MSTSVVSPPNARARSVVSLEGIEIIDPKNNNYIDSFANRLIELRGSDFSTLAEAKKKVQEPLVFGTLLHESNYADIHMCGAVETRAEVIRSFFHIIKTNRKEGIAASFFFIDNLQGGEKGAMLFSDCALNITPGARQLARIAYQTGNIAERIFGFDTHLSLLSYSTKGSGAGEQVDAVLEAGREVRVTVHTFELQGGVGEIITMIDQLVDAILNFCTRADGDILGKNMS